MTGEEFARICFAARPVLWALAIIAVLLAAAFLVPKIIGRNSGNGGLQDFLGADETP
jgi:hypothetical protein